jgi:hypothetical protein
MADELPEYRDWSRVAVLLMRGVVYSEDDRAWNILLTSVSMLESYFARLGLRLVVAESDGMAYLRQLNEDEATAGYDSLPKLFRSTRLSYGQTLLCVLLRDELRRFEEEEVRDERCVIDEPTLLQQWESFFPTVRDEVKMLRDMQAALRKLEELGFVALFGGEPAGWEVRRILKARLPASHLEELRDALAKHAGSE